METVRYGNIVDNTVEEDSSFFNPVHCHSLSLASVKSRLVLPFWYRLIWLVPDKGPFNGCMCVYYYHMVHMQDVSVVS